MTATPGPVLSVCMPTYGRPELLERALSSIINEGTREASRVEIVVSDNSPEVNRGVATRLLDAWPGPTRYLENPSDIGPIPNFNQSGREAAGRYVLFLHDDDRLLPGAIDAIVSEVAGSSDGRAAYLFGVEVTDETDRVRRHQTFVARRHLEPADALLRVLTDSTFVRMPGMTLRRDVFLEVGGFDVTVGNPTDFDLMIRVFSKHGVMCVPTTTAQYTVHPGAATSGMFNKATIETLMGLFDRARATGLITSDARLRRAQVDWFHQFILGGAYRELRGGRPEAARSILALFKIPAVDALGRSRRWGPMRALFNGLALIPDRYSRPLLGWIGRLRLERIWHPRS